MLDAARPVTRYAEPSGPVDAAVQAALDRIRPFLQRDGGDIELLGIVERRARVRLTGNCAGCPSAAVTLFLGVETYLREQVPELEGIQVV
jgi:Fe-S cluster biogenesis protein NfuA